MEKSKNNILPIILGAIFVALIVALLVYFLIIKKDNNPQQEESNSQIAEKTCEMVLEFDDVDYTLNTITYLKVKDNRVLSMQDVLQYKCQNIETYNELKAGLEEELLEENEQELTLKYKMTDVVDTTKDDEGNEQELLYDAYKLEKEGFGATCN